MNPGVLAGIGSAAIWAVASTMMASSSSRVDALSISAVRGAWGALLLLATVPFLLASGEFSGMDAGIVAALIGSAIVGFVFGDTLYIASLAALGLARAFTVSLGLFVLLTYILAVLVLDEEVTASAAAGSGLILVGVYLVALLGRRGAADEERAVRGWRQLAPGLGLVAITALLWAVATVWLTDAAEGQGAIAVGAVRLPAAAGVLMIAASVAPRTSLRRRAISRWDHGALLFAGLIGTGLGSLLFIYAVQEAGAGRAAVATAVSPLFAVPLGAIFLGERMSPWVLVGAVVAAAGIILIS